MYDIYNYLYPLFIYFLPFFHLQSFFDMHSILMSIHTWKFSDTSFDNAAESNIPFVGIETYSRYLQNTHTFSSRPRVKVAGVQYTDHSILYGILCIEVYFLKGGCSGQRPYYSDCVPFSLFSRLCHLTWDQAILFSINFNSNKIVLEQGARRIWQFKKDEVMADVTKRWTKDTKAHVFVIILTYVICSVYGCSGMSFKLFNCVKNIKNNRLKVF